MVIILIDVHHSSGIHTHALPDDVGTDQPISQPSDLVNEASLQPGEVDNSRLEYVLIEFQTYRIKCGG